MDHVILCINVKETIIQLFLCLVVRLENDLTVLETLGKF